VGRIAVSNQHSAKETELPKIATIAVIAKIENPKSALAALEINSKQGNLSGHTP